MPDAVDEAATSIEDEPEVVGDAAADLEAQEVTAIEIRKVKGALLEARDDQMVTSAEWDRLRKAVDAAR